MEQAEKQNESSVILYLEKVQERVGTYVQIFNPQVGALQMLQVRRRNQRLSKAVVLQGQDMGKDPEQNGVSARTFRYSTLEKDLV